MGVGGRFGSSASSALDSVGWWHVSKNRYVSQFQWVQCHWTLDLIRTHGCKLINELLKKVFQTGFIMVQKLILIIPWFICLRHSLTNTHPKISPLLHNFSMMVTLQVLSACEVWGVKVGVQVFKKKLHTYIHLNYVRVEFLSCKKKKKKNYPFLTFYWMTKE